MIPFYTSVCEIVYTFGTNWKKVDCDGTVNKFLLGRGTCCGGLGFAILVISTCGARSRLVILMKDTTRVV